MPKRAKGTFKLGLMGSPERERAMGIAHVATRGNDYVFAHHDDFDPPGLYDELKDGDLVEYVVVQEPKGPRAKKIRRAK